MSDDQRARDERRKKIRELEASLFGGSNGNSYKIDLPDLKNVDEYSAKYGRAEQKTHQPTYEQKISSILQKKLPTRSLKKMTKKEDLTHLLSDEEDHEEEREIPISALSRRARRGSDLFLGSDLDNSMSEPHNRNSGKSRPDPEQIDGTPPDTLVDPRKNILHNLKKKHGFTRSKRLDSLDVSHHEKMGQPTDVQEYETSLGKADILQNSRKENHRNSPFSYDKRFSDFLSSHSQARRATPESKSSSRRSSLASVLDDPKFIRDKSGTSSKTPTIQVENSTERRRTNPTLKSKSMKNISGMIDFDHLELPSDKSSHETFHDIPNVLDDLPKDVFDKIPRAVTAREEKRLELYHKKLERDRALRKAKEETRKESEQVAESHKVALIAALFSNNSEPRRRSNDSGADSEFMVALFFEHQEQTVNSDPSPKQEPIDPEVGHFCAPFCPGFCEANFCIFHSSKVGKSGD